MRVLRVAAALGIMALAPAACGGGGGSGGTGGGAGNGGSAGIDGGAGTGGAGGSGPGPVAGAALFFSDLTSGPNQGGQNDKGAFVTVWGNGFGDAQGASTVTIGGGAADNYPV